MGAISTRHTILAKTVDATLRIKVSNGWYLTEINLFLTVFNGFNCQILL